MQKKFFLFFTGINYFFCDVVEFHVQLNRQLLTFECKGFVGSPVSARNFISQQLLQMGNLPACKGNIPLMSVRYMTL